MSGNANGGAPRWQGLATALRFLLPMRRRREPADSAAAGRALGWIVPLGLVIGLVWVGGFRAAWRIYGEIATVRVIPALIIVVIETLFTGRYLVLGLARAIDWRFGERPPRSEANGPAISGEHSVCTPQLAIESLHREPALSPFGTLTMLLVVLSEWVLITSIPWESPWWPAPTDWRFHLRFLYPAPLYRPLLLAPIWGRWGIVLAATIGRTARYADAEAAALCQTMSPGRLLRQTILPLVLTAVYCSRGGNFAIGIIMSVLVFGVTYLAAVIMAHRGAGQSRQSFYAIGQIAQLAFLGICRAFWLIIHR